MSAMPRLVTARPEHELGTPGSVRQRRRRKRAHKPTMRTRRGGALALWLFEGRVYRSRKAASLRRDPVADLRGDVGFAIDLPSTRLAEDAL